MINHKLFISLPVESQGKLLRQGKKMNLDKGQTLFYEGDEAVYVYYVVKGALKVYKTGLEGNETIFNIYPKNSFVALGVLFKEDKSFPASGKAAVPSLVIALDIQLLEEAITASKEAARLWFNYLSTRLQAVQSLLSDQIFTDGKDRLKKLIKYFYENYPHQKIGDYIKIGHIPVSKQELADFLNIRRETLSRMLSSLKNSRICEYSGKELIVNSHWLFQEIN